MEKKFYKSFIWVLPNELLRDLSACGKILFVGGYVRDMAMKNNLPSDQDILIAGTSQENLLNLLSKYGRAELVGKSFGVIKFHWHGDMYDFSVPSLRTAHGNVPEPNLSIERDLMGRDLTVNAIAFDIIEKKIIDPANGLRDIKAGLLRQVCGKTFSADALRILRLCRFHAQLDFEIEENTFQDAAKNVDGLREIAMERIGGEFSRIMLLPAPSKALRCLKNIDALDVLMPELMGCAGITQPGGMHAYDVFDHILRTVDESSPELTVRFSALFHDIGKPRHRFIGDDGRARFYGHQSTSMKMAKKWLEKYGLSRKFAADVVKLVEYHMFARAETDKGIRRFIRRVGEELIEPLFQLRFADTKAQGIGGDLNSDIQYYKRVKDVIEQQPPLTVRALEVDGHDVMRILNIEPSAKVGEVLEKLLGMVIDDPSMNERDRLLEEIARLAGIV